MIMSFLPLVQRELAVAARKRGTAWGRVLSAGLALALAFLIINGSRMNPRLGQELLRAVTVLLLIEALFSGVRYTADCLSEEKREGTLGLLFLTPLNGWDIVAGKIAGRSLAAFYNMLGVIPIYGLSVLFGGVTGTQVGCLSIALAATTLFSLALGMLVSSRGWSEKNVLMGAVAAILIVCFVPYLLRQAVFWSTRAVSLDWVLYCSPIFAYSNAAAGNVARTLLSGTWLAASAMLMLGVASWRIRSAFRAGDEPQAPERKIPWAEATARRRGNLLQINPMFWLVMRQVRRGQVLGFAAFAICAGIVCRIAFETNGKGRITNYVLFGSYGVNVLFKVFLAVESSRRFNQDRRTGALELLLTSPLPVSLILQGQHLAIRRALFPALLGVAAMFLLWMLDYEVLREFVVMLPCSLLLLLYDAEAIRWFGMLHGLKTRRLTGAVTRTVVQVIGIPVAVFMLVIFASRGMGQYEAQAFVFLWTLGCVIYNTILIRYAKSKLDQLRSLAAGDRWRPAWVAGGLPVGTRERLTRAAA